MFAVGIPPTFPDMLKALVVLRANPSEKKFGFYKNETSTQSNCAYGATFGGFCTQQAVVYQDFKQFDAAGAAAEAHVSYVVYHIS